MRSRGATLSNCSKAILDSNGQLFWNLDGSATGLLSYARENVNVKAGAYVMLAVSDTGVGMTEGIRSRVFEPFFTTKEQGKGTGLGLSTVYGIIKQSGGHIAVYSEPGIGSTFKVYLPEVNNPAEARAPSPQAISMSGRNETILVVEDEDGVRALVQHILQKHGYRTLVASGGAEALEIGSAH